MVDQLKLSTVYPTIQIAVNHAPAVTTAKLVPHQAMKNTVLMEPITIKRPHALKVTVSPVWLAISAIGRM